MDKKLVDIFALGYRTAEANHKVRNFSSQKEIESDAGQMIDTYLVNENKQVKKNEERNSAQSNK